MILNGGALRANERPAELVERDKATLRLAFAGGGCANANEFAGALDVARFAKRLLWAVGESGNVERIDWRSNLARGVLRRRRATLNTNRRRAVAIEGGFDETSR